MDRNSFIGLLLIGAILVAYSIYTAPGEEEIKAARAKAAQVTAAKKEAEKRKKSAAANETETTADSIAESNAVLSDSILAIQKNDLYGEFSASAGGEEVLTVVETDELKLTFSNRGGRMVSAVLKNYRRSDSSELRLFEKGWANFNLNFFTNANKNIYTDELYFTGGGENFRITGGESRELRYSLKTNDGRKGIDFVYTIKGGGFLADLRFEMHSMDQVVDRGAEEFALNWVMAIPSQEKSLENQRINSTIYYKYEGEDPDYISETSEEKEDLIASVEWVAFKQQYFNTSLIGKEAFSKYNASVETAMDKKGPFVKHMRAVLAVPFGHSREESFEMSFFLGPNHFQTLEDLDAGLEVLIPLGWGIFGWVNEWLVIPIFNFLDTFNLNYGIIILLMTIFIKILLFPVTWKTYISSAKMKVLKPEITEISQKHKDDAMKKQQAMMALYRQAGVNPLAGCVPLLIQMPILFAMFRFFPASIELRQQPFLWADDLSTYDSVLDLPFSIPFYGEHVSLFCLLMALSMVFYTKINSGQMGMDAGGGASEMMAMQMKIMMYLMPVMMLFFFNSYSSGLSYYYLVANVISMAQMLAIKKWFVDEDKIHKQIQMNKARPAAATKSRFQKRLEEMAKQRGLQQKKK